MTKGTLKIIIKVLVIQKVNNLRLKQWYSYYKIGKD